MLYFIGLGLGSAEDITVRGLEIVRKCSHIYLESYTATLPEEETARLEELYRHPIVVADREMVENQAEEILEQAKVSDVAFLVVGDVFCATTHTDITQRAIEMGVQFKVVHNASIMNAVSCCGLQLYHFGQTVSIPFFTESWKPESFYDKIAVNRKAGFHTLCLLDIKVKEPSLESLARGKKKYEPPRFMTVNQAIAQLIEVEEKREEKVIGPETICVGLARVGAHDQIIVSGTMADLLDIDFGKPLHSLVISGHMHPSELDMAKYYSIAVQNPPRIQKPADEDLDE
eukprot:TRINITY_DN8694_c0_g1_i1.p1 TRINITY_DN8694_c0_g1~~TRINITY_DN8694_c0_g1_i1.p1  ORF type:complete len:287 (+),score=73.28 TRINITY_DN8694_c0_g1_i1:50-910(+)